MPSEVIELQVAAHARARAGVPTFLIETEGAAIGLVRVVATATESHLVDIFIEPSERGRGVGAVVLEQVLDPALPARAEVDVANAGARRFYARLGFEEVESDGVHITLRRAARPATG